MAFAKFASMIVRLNNFFIKISKQKTKKIRGEKIVHWKEKEKLNMVKCYLCIYCLLNGQSLAIICTINYIFNQTMIIQKIHSIKKVNRGNKIWIGFKLFGSEII